MSANRKQRTLKNIHSDINKVQANIKQVSAPNFIYYTKKDKELLIPHYKEKLEKLNIELAAHTGLKSIDVVDPIFL